MRPSPRPDAELQLICFPCGGGGASLFRSWPDHVGSRVEIGAIQLPGRETRLREPRPGALADLIDALVAPLREHLDRPYALIGHSMGASIAFEFARRQRRDGYPLPTILVVASRRAPQLPPSKLHTLPREKLIALIRDTEGTPRAIFANPKWMEFYAQIVQDDIRMCETHAYEPEPPLGCPIAAFGGCQDDLVPLNDLRAWELQTSDRFSVEQFEGGHFFEQRNLSEFLAAVAEQLHGGRLS